MAVQRTVASGALAFRKLHIAALAVLFLLVSCGYEGDGQFESFGIWPLRTYTLQLPDVPLESGNTVEFDLSGYKSHGRSLLEVLIDSKHPIAFHAIDTAIELRIADGFGTTYFYRKGQLNQHYLRMAAEAESSWPLETEWDCDHSYDDANIDSRAVSFDPNRVPVPARSLRCWHFLPTGQHDLHMTVRMENVPKQFTNMVLRIELSSGGK